MMLTLIMYDCVGFLKYTKSCFQNINLASFVKNILIIGKE